VLATSGTKQIPYLYSRPDSSLSLQPLKVVAELFYRERSRCVLSFERYLLIDSEPASGINKEIWTHFALSDSEE
jgi:hypothetical protein